MAANELVGLPSTLQQFMAALLASNRPLEPTPYPVSPMVSLAKALLLSQAMPAVIGEAQREWQRTRAQQWLEALSPTIEAALKAGTAESVEFLKGLAESGKEHFEALGINPNWLPQLAEIVRNQDIKKLNETMPLLMQNPFFGPLLQRIFGGFTEKASQPSAAPPLAAPPASSAVPLGGGWSLVPSGATTPTVAASGQVGTASPSATPPSPITAGGSFFRPAEFQPSDATALLAMGALLGGLEGTKPIGALLSTLGASQMRLLEQFYEQQLFAQRQALDDLRNWFYENLPYMSQDEAVFVGERLGLPNASEIVPIIQQGAIKANKGVNIVPSDFVKAIGRDKAVDLYGEDVVTMLENINAPVSATAFFSIMGNLNMSGNRSERHYTSVFQSTLSVIDREYGKALTDINKLADKIASADDKQFSKLARIASQIKSFFARPETVSQPTLKAFADLVNEQYQIVQNNKEKLETRKQALLRIIDAFRDLVSGTYVEANQIAEKLGGSPSQVEEARNEVFKLRNKVMMTLFLLRSVMPEIYLSETEKEVAGAFEGAASRMQPEQMMALLGALVASKAAEPKPPIVVAPTIVTPRQTSPVDTLLAALLAGQKLPPSPQFQAQQEERQFRQMMAERRQALSEKRFQLSLQRFKQASQNLKVDVRSALNTVISSMELINTFYKSLEHQIRNNPKEAEATLRRIFPQGFRNPLYPQRTITWRDLDELKASDPQTWKEAMLEILVSTFGNTQKWLEKQVDTLIKTNDPKTAYTVKAQISSNPTLSAIKSIPKSQQRSKQSRQSAVGERLKAMSGSGSVSPKQLTKTGGLLPVE